jgi:cytochrome c-type biogenesis protein CcmF
MAPSLSLRRLIGLPRTAFSTALAHLGLGVTVIGIVSASAWQTELVTTMQPGTARDIAGYSVTLQDVTETRGENFTAETARFTVRAPNGGLRTLSPERRFYPASQTPTTEAAIETYGFSQLYLQLGEVNPDGSHVVRAWFKPYVTLIWLGCLVMAGAGVLSLSDRRLRIGAPRPAATKTAPAE